MQKMIATDIDGTIYDGFHSANEFFDLMSRKSGIIICYVTSRSLPSTLNLIDSGLIPKPNYICASVGTVIYDYYSQQEIDNYVCQSLDGWNPSLIKKIYCEGIILQEPSEQSPRKISYYWDGQHASLNLFKEILKSVMGCRFIVSSGRFIDVIPAKMGKGAAIEYLAWILDIPSSSILGAGDTETDIEICQISGGFVIPQGTSSKMRKAAKQMNHNVYEATRSYGEGVVDAANWFWGHDDG